MLKIYFLLLAVILLCSMCRASQKDKSFQRSGSSSSSEYDKYADDRIHADAVLNHPDYIVTREKAVSKQNWEYKHSPRSGSLYIRTASNKVLYPGELNTVRNAIRFQDFLDDFFIRLPHAKTNTQYTFLAYSEGYLAKAITDLRGEDLFEGIKGENLGHVFQGFNAEEVGGLVAKDTKYCIEILEQNPNEHLTNLGDTKSDWSDPKKKFAKELNGTAGKTCFVVLPRGMEELEKDFYSEFELLITTFECHIRDAVAARSGTRSTRTNSASEMIASAIDDAINKQIEAEKRQREALNRRAQYVGNPQQNSFYSKGNQI